MLSTLSEQKSHLIRWSLLLAWGLLIVSLFYDPVSAVLTAPENTWSPLADGTIAAANNLAHCVKIQGECITLRPYAIGTRVFWGMVVPSAIFVVLVFGHEFWRRICPLYFFSQLPRALGLSPLLDIEKNQWLRKNHLYVQFVLFYLGITGRILLFNSVRPVVSVFFIFTLLSAAGIVALYGGRSWCHYVCPFGMVQTVFTGPRGLLDSEAHMAAPYSLTQSMCRTVDSEGQVQSACVSCKSSCMDIDSEQSYWTQMHQPGRQLVQYGYLGLVMGYFAYYALYAGNFKYYFSGVWSHEPGALVALFKPGFYVMGQAIAIPKIVAAPLTLAAFAAASYAICTRLERYYRGYLKAKQQVPQTSQQAESAGGSVVRSAGGLTSKSMIELSRHRLFSICTFLAFNIFFIYGGRPELNNLPIWGQFVFQTLIGVVSSLWLLRTWGRSSQQYQTESLADKRRRRLRKLPMNVSELLGDRSLEQLSPEELDILAQTLPQLVPPSVPVDPDPATYSPQTMPQTILKRPLPQTNLSSPKPLRNKLPRTRFRKRKP